VKKNTPAIQNPGRQEILQRQEQQFLDAERQDPASPYYLGATDVARQRRRFMIGAAALGATTMSRTAMTAVPPGTVDRPVPADASRVLGTGVGEDGGYGSRSQFETEVCTRYATKTALSSWSFTPLEKGHGIITPSAYFGKRKYRPTRYGAGSDLLAQSVDAES